MMLIAQAQVEGMTIVTSDRLFELYKVEVIWNDYEMKAFIDNLVRMIVAARYRTAHKQVIAEMNIEHLEPLVTEDDFLAAAVSLTERK